ncbi:glycoside hydrolase family 43 protein [Sporolactobacillus shoreicorticis]|nr:glycoside hydrolase family 43 protein [Sporolactobacillus shoreicorticis]
MWKSNDLIHWQDQKMLTLGTEDFGCLWAPDVIFNQKTNDYIVHWSSSYKCDNFKSKAIFYSRTKDFKSFGEPQILYKKDDSDVIDSAMYAEGDWYYLFVKSGNNPQSIILLRSKNITGPFERVKAFDRSMSKIEQGKYEAPTAVKVKDGRWALFLDYYGTGAEGQGYIPFIADTLESGNFIRSDKNFSFPYGYKHGTILKISDEEYSRLKAFHKLPSEY